MSNWRLSAACLDVDPDLFFSNETGDRGKAKRVCRECPVIRQCFRLVMHVESVDLETGKPWSSPWVDKIHRHGVFAGFTGYERWLLTYPELEEEAKQKHRRGDDRKAHADDLHAMP